MADVLIDLDRPDPHGDPGAGPSGNRLPWAQLRYAVAVVLLLATVALVGPGEPAHALRFAPPTRLAAAGADEFYLAGEVVVVLAGRDPTLTAYGLDGYLRWAVRPPLRQAHFAYAGNDVILLASGVRPRQVTALNVRDGSVAWTGDGSLVGYVGGTVVLGRPDPDDDPAGDLTRLAGVDARTGRLIWAAALPPLDGTNRTLDVLGGGGRRLATGRVNDEGTGELIDLSTGRRTPIRGVPTAPPTPTASGPRYLDTFQLGTANGDATVVYSVTGDPSIASVVGPSKLVGYGPGLGSPLWTIESGTWAVVYPCGPWLCVADVGRTRVIDPATGRELRTVGSPQVIAGSSRRLLGYDYAGAVVTTDLAVFDAGTGAMLGQYTGWNLVRTEMSDWLPIVRRRAGLTWEIASLSVETGTAFRMDTFEAAGEQACQSTATHVACSVRSGEVLVWRHAPTS